MMAALACLLLALAQLLKRVESSGAIPPSEFAPATTIFASAPVLILVAAVLIVIAICQRWQAQKKTALLLTLIGTALAGLSFIQPWFISLAAAFMAIEAIQGRAFPSLAIRNFGKLSTTLTAVGDALLILFPASLILAFGEFFGRTHGLMQAGILEREVMLPYLAAVAGFATLATTKAALTLITVLASVALVQLMTKAVHSDAAARLQALGLAGVITWSHFRLIDLCMKDEFDQIGLYPQLLAMGLSIALFLTPFCGRLLVATEGQLIRLPRSLALIPGGRGKVGLAIHLVVMLALVPMLYPQVQDYRERIFDCVALLGILYLTAVVVRVGLGPILKRLRLVGIVGVVLGFVAFATLGQRPDLRLIAFEYSRFAALGTSAPWSRFLETEDRLGLVAPLQEAPFHQLLAATTETVAVGESKRPAIILFVWDAARYDRMSIMGHARDTTPNLSELAKSAVVFEAARSSATATTISVRNLLSGTYNSRFMLTENHAPFLVKSLAELGYDDFFITVTGTDFNGVSGEAFLRGWQSDQYREHFQFEHFPNRDGLKPDGEKVDRLLDHLDQKLKTQGDLSGLFAFVHLTGTHSPWKNDKALRDYGSTAEDRYDGEMFKLDALLGKTMELLKNTGHFDDTILVITSDHGTGLGEHGRLAGFFPYEEQVRVPFILKAPSLTAQRVAEPVSSLDIAPTILDLCGDPNWPGFGQSLMSLLTDGNYERAAFVTYCAFQDSYAIYDPSRRYKLHYHRGRGYQALFDLEVDPQERRNLLLKKPEMAEKLRLQLAHFLWDGRHHHGNPYHYRSWEPPR